MFNPFTTWQRLIAAGAEMAQTNVRAVEMLVASNEVIRARAEMIGVALSRPGEADTRELMRMVPEKTEALSKAGLAAATDLWEAHGAWMREFENFGAMMLRGRLPTMDEWGILASRNMAFALTSTEHAAGAPSRAMAPIHKRVTSNAKRLRAKG
jgi:hypothetical protein